MIDGYESILISLRQADGEHYPLFHRGDPDTCNIALVPATKGQVEADIQFFYHSVDQSETLKLGTLRFADLPDDAGESELRLDAAIGAAGILTITVRHPESGRVERLEMELPDEPGISKSSRPRGPGWRNRPIGWVLGALFVVVSLVAIYLLTSLVTDWGKQAPAKAPLSLISEENSEQRT